MGGGKKRRVEEYPLFSFRTRNTAEKARLDALVEAALAARNSALDAHKPRAKKNQLIIEALENGLDTIRAYSEKRKS